jgi:hypothetical protein
LRGVTGGRQKEIEVRSTLIQPRGEVGKRSRHREVLLAPELKARVSTSSDARGEKDVPESMLPKLVLANSGTTPPRFGQRELLLDPGGLPPRPKMRGWSGTGKKTGHHGVRGSAKNAEKSAPGAPHTDK